MAMRIILVLFLSGLSCSQISDFGKLRELFPLLQLEALEIDEEVLSKSFYTKHHPQRALNNLLFELPSIEEKYVGYLCSNYSIDTFGYLCYGKFIKDSFIGLVYLKTDTVGTEINDCYKLVTMSDKGSMIDEIVIGSLKSISAKENEYVIGEFKGDTLLRVIINERFGDMDAPPESHQKEMNKCVLEEDGSIRELN
jgi:hypothetical protein